MTQPDTNSMTLDGRQTAGRKGFAYDWRRVMLEGLDTSELSITDDDLASLLSTSTPA